MDITVFLDESYKIYGKPAPVIFDNVKKTEWHSSLTTFIFNAKQRHIPGVQTHTRIKCLFMFGSGISVSCLQ